MVVVGVDVAEQDGGPSSGLMTTSIFPSLKRSPKAAPRPGATWARPVPSRAGRGELFACRLRKSSGRWAKVVPQSCWSTPGIDVAVDHEDVFPAVVVVVHESRSPAEKGNGVLCEARVVADVGEIGVAIVVIEDVVVVGEVGYEEVVAAVVIIVADGYSHGGYFASVLVEREARGVAVSSKVPLPLLM